VSLTVVPVRVAGEVWGCLGVASRQGELPADAEQRLERFADAAATAISHAAARARLVHQANTDALTGLANHRSFQERLREEVARAHRYGRPLSLVLIDLDVFKVVNDAHGHAAGDQALAEVARRLQTLARPGDVLARLGGDEFGWVLAETDALQAYAAAERARALIAGRPLFEDIVSDASAGVCGLEETEDPDELMRLADGALYWAKTHGRGVTYRYTPAVVRELSAAERAERLARQRTLAGLRALARAVDAKDHSTREHSERVADIAELIAGELEFDDATRVDLREAALLHDVGKIGVPDAVLFKPAALSDDEFEMVKAHAALGATIASEVLNSRQVAWVRSHHERWAGGGYPDGLVGDDVPVGGRILALADAWDVMVNVRTYKPAVQPEQALQECLRCAGTQFWPEAVDALARIVASGRLTQPADERTPAI
jgi:diguanylate cyclase (GGDEF)-like protein/putative nucleotidyltransferase with HDIG domain